MKKVLEKRRRQFSKIIRKLHICKKRCLKFLDFSRFLNAGSDELSRTTTSFPISEANGMECELFKKISPPKKIKLLNRFMNHWIQKKNFFSNLKQSYPDDEGKTRTKSVSEKYNNQWKRTNNDVSKRRCIIIIRCFKNI